MKQQQNSCIRASLILAAVLLLAAPNDAVARGGFGGGFGGGGRGFGGGDFGRGDFGRSDWGARFGDRGDFDRMFDNQGAAGLGYHGPDAFTAPARAEDASGRLLDTGIRDYGGGRDSDIRNLATDGAFGRIASTPAGAAAMARWSPADLATRASYLNGNFNHWNWFNRNWWADRPWAWYNRLWPDYWCWGGVGWGDLAGYWGVDDDIEPAYYDYGNNITYQGDNVYYGSQPLEPASTYYQQAQTLALSAPPVPPPSTTPPKGQSQSKSTATGDWKPLGVFALTAGDDQSGNQLFQLAVDKKGTIRGNYYNALTNETKQVSGAVDKKNMRACWTIAGNKNLVYDTGVGNLLKDASPILVHFSKTDTRQCMLVRLKNPGQGGTQTAEGS